MIMSLARAAADVEKGKQMIRQCEYEGEFGGK
jgi:hypothetical protein